MQAEPQTHEYRAYAKINLSLEILGKRPDGFHNIASVLQAVDLYDILRVVPAQDLHFDCNLEELVDESNLVWQAALLLHELYPREQHQGAALYLEKQIPVAAGLGGGSSDGAATLVALNQLWNLKLEQTQLVEIAARLGSDVPFFVQGGTVLVEGRGEKLTPLPALPPTWLLLLYPLIDMPANKTKELYRMLGPNDFTNGTITRALVRTLERGEKPPYSLIFNGFERAVYERFPRLDQYRQALVGAGADHVWVSGSGPTLFTLVDDEATGHLMLTQLQQAGYAAYLVKTI